MVEDLTIGNRGVARLAEGFRQGGCIRDIFFRIASADESLGGGKDAGHQAGAGSHADRHLAVGALENQCFRGQLVDVRSFCLLTAVATQFGSEIVDGEEEGIRLLCRSKWKAAEDRKDCEEGSGVVHGFDDRRFRR